VRRFAALLVIALGGCANHTFVPGPGMSSVNLEPDKAQCRLIAKGMRTGFEFESSGSPKFVAASTGGAVIGYAVASAVEQNGNYNDCMEARGWRIADGESKAAGTSRAAIETSTTLAASSDQIPANPRRDFRILVDNVTFVTDDLLPPHGVIILQAGAGGAGASAGLQPRDVIMDFKGSPITDLSDLQRIMASVGPGTTVMANIRRDGKEMPVAIRF
jgi:hypothetical protein